MSWEKNFASINTAQTVFLLGVRLLEISCSTRTGVNLGFLRGDFGGVFGHTLLT